MKTYNKVNFNGGIGWQSQGLTLSSSWNQGGANNCTGYSGMDLQQNASSLSVSLYKVNLTNNQSGLFAESGNLYLKCNNITDNAEYGFDIWHNASLNMSALLSKNGGYNVVTRNGLSKINYPNINLDQAGSISGIHQGFNDLSTGVTHHFQQYAKKVFAGTLVTCSGSLSVFSNRWFASSSLINAGPNGGNSPVYSITCSSTGAPIFLNDGSPQIASCGAYDPPPPPPCISCPILSSASGRFANVKLNDAVVIASSKMSNDSINMVDSTSNDLEAVASFKEILMLPIDSSNNEARYWYDNGLRLMNIALGRAFGSDKYTTAELNTAVQQALDVHNRLIVQSNQQNFLEQFNLHLSKAQVYRLAGDRNSALQEFNSISANCFLTSKDRQLLKRWIALTSAENKIINGEVPRELSDSLLAAMLPPIDRPKPGIINSTSTINNSAQLGIGVQVGAGTTIDQNTIIGNNVTIGSGVAIKQGTKIGDGTIIGNQTTIDQNSVIGQNVIIGNNVSIKQTTIVGDKTQISDNVLLDQNVKIGGLVFIGPKTSIKQNAQISDGTYLATGITFDQNISLGSSVIVMDSATFKQGVKIGNNAIVGRKVILNQNTRVGANAVVADGLTIGQNAKVCDGLTANNNLASNGSLGTCAAPSAPSPIGQVPYNCAFALYRAKTSGNFFNGFTAQNTDISKKDFCASTSIGFKPNTLSSQYQWNFGDCAVSTDENPTHIYTKPGIYVITLVQTVGCTSSITNIGAITVLPPPNSTFESYPLSCSSAGSILFDINNLLPALNAPSCSTAGSCISYNTLDSSRLRIKYTFDFNSEFPSFSEIYTFKQIAANTDSILKRTYTQSGQHTVILTAQLQIKDLRTGSWSNTSCISTSINDFLSGLHLRGTMDFTIACINQPVAFSGNASGGTPPYNFSWNLGNGNTSTLQNPSKTYSISGTFTVTLAVTDARGCKDTSMQFININPLPTAKFGFDVCNTSVSFHDSSSNAITFHWDFGDGNTSDDESPIHDYASSGTYSVCLTATNQCGNNSTCQNVVLIPQNQWTQKANFGGTARSGVTSFAIGNKGYMGTGYDDNNLLQDFWEYDPQTDTWTQKATFPGVARFVSVGFYFSVGDKGYFGTGWNGSGATDQSDLWEYNATLNSWTQKASFGGGQRNGAIGFSIGNKGYIGTGWNITDYPIYFHQDFWEYDTQTDTWTQKANFAGPGRQGAVGLSIGSKGYIGLGGGGSGSYLSTFFNDFWEYDQQSDTWTQRANLPAIGRQWAVGFGIGTKGYMGTGGTYPNGPHYADFWEWDQATDTWAQKADFGGGARNLASGFSIGTKGYLGTGHDGSPKDDFWEFTPGSNPCAPQVRSGNNTQPPPVTINTPTAIFIYPNPNNGDMTVKYTIPENQAGKFELYNIIGVKVTSYQLQSGGANSLSIFNSDLQEGIYLYHIISNDKMIEQGKIVVIK